MSVESEFTAETSDGRIDSTDSSYNNARAGTGTLSAETGELRVGQLLLGDFAVFETFLDFDISAIPTSHQILSVTLELWVTSLDTGGSNLNVNVRNLDWGATLTTDDWVPGAELSSTGSLLASESSSGMTEDAFNEITEDGSSFRDFIEETVGNGGNARLVLYSNRHLNGTEPSGAEFIRASTTSDTGEEPKLTVEHEGELVAHTASGGLVAGGQAELETVPLHTHHATGGAVAGGVAAVDVEGGPQVDSDVVVEWDFDNDGDFDQSEEDVTSLLLSGEASLGRDFPSQLQGRSKPGTFKGLFRNDLDRFSYFNTSSPYNQDPFSLRVGRKIRVRTAEAASPDPTLIIRDRFRRDDGAVGTAPTGQEWTNSDGTTPASTSRYRIADERMVAQSVGSTFFAVIDTGVDDYYLQATFTDAGRATVEQDDTVSAGLLFRYQDVSNHLFFDVKGTIDDNDAVYTLELGEFISGASTVLETVDLHTGVYDELTLGVRVSGGEVRAYWEGVHVATAEPSEDFDGETHVGITTTYGTRRSAPKVDELWVWDDLPSEVEGILWTGLIDRIRPTVRPGPEKVAEVTASGVLSKAARSDIDLPGHVSGSTAGHLVGATLWQADLAQPPGPHGSIDTGVVSSGAVLPIQGADALRTLRRWETFEAGFVHETPEGYVAFDERGARDGTVAAVAFTDGVGQFHYQRIEPLDRAREIINRVTFRAAPEAPSTVAADEHIIQSIETRSRSFGVRNDVDPLVPSDVEDGDLVIFIIASTVGSTAAVDWNVPVFWVEGRRNRGEEDGEQLIGLRVYWAQVAETFHAGRRFTFYSDTSGGGVGGAWICRKIRIPRRHWYGSHDRGGPEISNIVRRDSSGGTVLEASNAPAIQPSWGTEPTLYIAARVGLTSNTGGSEGTVHYPEGYTRAATNFLNGSLDGFDAILQTCLRTAAVEEEDPDPFFTGATNFVVHEAATLAVRGYNGPAARRKETSLGTLLVPETGRFSRTVHDRDSQEDHNLIQSADDEPDLFAFDADGQGSSDGETYAATVLDTYADDRPIVTISFTANRNANYRIQALRRRVGDRIRLIANNNAGLGIDQDFFIEKVSHRWSNGTKLWEVTWELSPA